jgi:hypothetical protein
MMVLSLVPLYFYYSSPGCEKVYGMTSDGPPPGAVVGVVYFPMVQECTYNRCINTFVDAVDGPFS